MDDGTVYDYTTAGFDKFFSRSVDNIAQANLDSQGPVAIAQRFDDTQVSGALGNVLSLGNITIDGVKGRISVYDDNRNETIRIGELDD